MISPAPRAACIRRTRFSPARASRESARAGLALLARFARTPSSPRRGALPTLIEHEGSLASLVRGTDRPGAERVAIAGSLIRRDRHDRIDDDNSQKLLGYWR